GIRLRGNANVRRQIIAGTQFMRNDAADAWILDRRARPPAGEHIMGAAIVISLSMRHGADDADFVSDSGRLLERLGKINTVEPGLHRPERATIFNRRQQLWIERFLGRNSSRQENVND